jgi:hypothetical protein
MSGEHDGMSMEKVGAVQQDSGAQTNHDSVDSGNVFGISEQWVDDQGNVKPSQHHGSTGDGNGGEPVNVNEVAEAAKAMGMSDQDIQKFVSDFTSDPKNFNANQTDDQKRVGAATALNETIAAQNINHLGLGEQELRQASGDAVQAAQAGDAGQLRNVLEGAGGDTGNMTDQQLLNVWSSNTHPLNHEILQGDAFQLTHLRSISKPDAADGSGSDPVGYMNDKSDWTQWDAVPAANRFLEANKLFG